MSAIASFIKLPKSTLHGLREVAIPKKWLFGAPRDIYHDYLEENGQAVADYKWSGFVLATLLPYLKVQHEISLMDSDYNELGTFLTKSRGVTHFIFINEHKHAFLAKLNGEFSELALREYYNKFNETKEAEVGKPMLDGIQALRQSLSALDENSVIVFSIG